MFIRYCCCSDLALRMLISSRAGLRRYHPRMSWRWKGGDRRSDFQELLDVWEKGFVGFPCILPVRLFHGLFQSADLQAVTVVIASFQSCSNLIGPT
jgi:hypothetical protein